MRRVLIVLGTRPEAIKMAPVVLALQAHPEFEPVVAVTAQHRELLDDVLELFGIVPEHDLDIMEHGQTITQVTCRVLTGIGRILEIQSYDAMLVHGDTSTTIAATMAAFYHRVPVGHVEAGMRTGDLAHPFPEEANRSLTARLAHWHFPPSKTCEDNLLAEGIDPARIFLTPHNTVIDALRIAAKLPHEFAPGPIADALQSGRRVVLVTAHRRESWGTPMEGIFSALAQVARECPDTHFLVATHPNPVVSDAAQRILGGVERVELIGAQGYLQFVHLMSAAELIVSDSGGIQEEGPALGTPVLVLRDVTEYPELVERGVVALAGTAEETVLASVTRLLNDANALKRMTDACAGAHSGDSTEVIVRALLDG